MSQDILTELDGQVLRVTLNRPETGNGMTDEMSAKLTEIIGAADKQARVVVLRGAGDDFCSGRDGGPRPPAGTPQPQKEALQRRREFDTVFNLYGAFRDCRIPIIAVVKGRARGLGCSMAALSDITIAADTAKFQVPEMSYNVLPTMVLSSFVDRLTRKAINYLVHSTAEISAERALTFGIVSDVLPEPDLEEKLDALIAAIMKAPPIATEAVKDYLRHAMHIDSKAAVDLARNLHATINSSSEMRKW